MDAEELSTSNRPREAVLAPHCPSDVLRRLPGHFNDDLAQAARAGDVVSVARLLGRGAAEGFSPETHIAWEGTPLMVAARSGRTDVIRLLLERGCRVNTFLESGSTALHDAARGGHYAAACLLLERGADLNAIGDGKTPLAQAVNGDCLPLVQELCRRGAELQGGGKGGDTPLSLALSKGRWPITLWLLQAGAGRAAHDRWGATTLIAAIWGGVTSEQAAWLLDAGEDVHAVHLGQGGTALHAAALVGNVDVACLLLDRGAGLEARDNQSRTPLHEAARRGQAGTLRLLLSAGADQNARDATGQTPLFLAAESARTEAAQILLDAGANIEAADKNGVTPLLRVTGWAAYEVTASAQMETARLLLTRGADPNAASRKSLTPLHNALITHKPDLVRLLLERGADAGRADAAGKIGVLALAAQTPDAELTRLLLDAGAAVDGRDNLDKTALMIATYQNNKPLMTLLLERGADPNAVTKKGKSVLAFATKGKRERVTLVKLLRDAGAQSGGNETPS